MAAPGVVMDDVLRAFLPGNATAVAGVHRWLVTQNIEIQSVQVSAGTAPVGATAIYDLNGAGGTTLFTTQANRPTIAAAGTLSNEAVPDAAKKDVAAGTTLIFDCDQIGSGTAQANVAVAITYRYDTD